MSTPIDFDLRSLYESSAGGQTKQLALGIKPRVRLGHMDDVDPESHKAAQANNDDIKPRDATSTCCGWNIDLMSSVTSGILLAITIYYASAKFSDANVLFNQDLLLYAGKSSHMATVMRQFRTSFQDYSGKDIVIQVPHWREEKDIVAMPVSVKGTHVSIIVFLLWVYFWSCFFQAWRYRASRQWYYKPWLGPEFSRWLEYLFTSPSQAVLVSIAFGLVNVDVLIGHFGMQAAMVLFGYDIEQQVKKQFKYILQQSTLKKWQDVSCKRMHNVPSRNLRLYVYLGVSWLLHLLIWGVPPLTAWGIGGNYYRTQRLQDEFNKHWAVNSTTNATSGATSEAPRMPWYVELIFWSQYISFTVFGVVCTAQVLTSLRMNFPSEEDVKIDLLKELKDRYKESGSLEVPPTLDDMTTEQLTRLQTPTGTGESGRDLRTELFKKRVRQNWLRYTNVYAILSITAKTFLEIGFIGLLQVWKSWEDDAVFNRLG